MIVPRMLTVRIRLARSSAFASPATPIKTLQQGELGEPAPDVGRTTAITGDDPGGSLSVDKIDVLPIVFTSLKRIFDDNLWASNHRKLT